MKTRARRRSQAGFTLVEAAVVTAFFVGLTGLVYGTFRYQTHTYQGQSAQSVTQTGLRLWLERMARDVRRACYDPQRTGSFRILANDPSELRFSFAVDSNGDGVADASGVAGFRAHEGALQLWQGSGWRTLVEGVEELSFTYRNAGGAETEAPESIALVEIRLAARASSAVAPGLPPPLLTRTIAAEIRNDADCEA